MDLLCKEINDLRKYIRTQRIDISTPQGRKKFDDKFNASLRLKIKDNERFDKEEFRSLVGTLMHAVNKLNKLTDNGTKEIVEVFLEAQKNKTNKEQKKQEGIEKKKVKEYTAQKRMEDQLENEAVVNKDLYKIYTNTMDEFLKNKEIGYTLTYEDTDMLFHSAWKEFSQESTLAKKDLDKIYDEFYGKFVY
jgi:hypothetical protein